MPTDDSPQPPQVGTVALATTAVARGGVWRHVEDLACGLRAAGVDVVIGLLPEAVELQAASDRLGLRWESLRQSIGGHVDIWHAHLHDTYDSRVLAALARRRLVGPSVLTEHLPRSPASDPSLEPHFRR